MRNKKFGFLLVTTAIASLSLPTISFAQAVNTGTEAGTQVVASAGVEFKVAGDLRRGEGVIRDLKVDRKVNLNVVPLRTGGPQLVSPGAQNVIVPFRWTNTSNAPIAGAFSVSIDAGAGQNQNLPFDVIIDRNGDGVETPNVDTVVLAGNSTGFNAGDVAPGAALDFLIRLDVPASAPAETLFVTFTMEARNPQQILDVDLRYTPGTKINYTLFNDMFTLQRVDTVLVDNNRDGIESATDAVQIQAPAMLVDLFPRPSFVVDNTSGGPVTAPMAVPGADVTYCVRVFNGGEIAAEEVSALVDIPDNASFKPGSLRTDVTVVEADPAFFDLLTCSGGTVQDDDSVSGDDILGPTTPTSAGFDSTAGATGKGRVRLNWFEVPVDGIRWGSFTVVID